MAGVKSKQFIFDNQPTGLYPLMADIITFIQQDALTDDAVIQKTKMILIEFLTNAIKHCGDAKTFVEIGLTAVELVIKKKDAGNAVSFEIGGSRYIWPLAGVPRPGTHFSIYDHYGCKLMAFIKDECNLRFWVEEPEFADDPDFDAMQLPEHFGLMIIARASNRFEYFFDRHNCTNNFIATVALADKY